jgi:hypothetical protein
MTSTVGPYEIHTQVRGAHWIGWVSRPGSDKPERSVVLIGKTEEEALRRAQAWAASLEAI